MTRMKVCYLCSSNSISKVDGTVRDAPNISVLSCDSCGLVFLDSFDHIDKNFYEDSKMRSSEESISKWRKETLLDDTRRLKFLKNQINKKKVLDYGAGNGQFLKLAKRHTKSVTAIELDKESKSWLKKDKIDYFSSFDEIKSKIKFDVITAFHVIEHLKDPIELLKTAAGFLEDNGKIFLEVPNADDSLLSLYKCKGFSSFTYWSCHLMTFNESTIRRVVENSGLKCADIKQVQRYPLSNHLYWLSNGLPGGHQKWSFFNDKKLDKEYKKRLSALKKCDTLFVEVNK